MDPAHATLSDRYELIEAIGEGGFSSVFKAVDTRLEREVAIKILNPTMSQDPQTVERFMSEAKITASLKHPSALRIFDYGQTEQGELYIVSELLIGESLQEKINREGTINEVWLLHKISSVCIALHEAHQAGIIHRDLKPANLFVHQAGGEERLILIDFGISKVTQDQNKHHTQTGQIFGTPLYMSPEQIIQVKDVDHRSDLYSLGVIIFYALSGSHPFSSDVIYTILTKHLNEAPPHLYEINPDVYPVLSDLTHELLQKQPEDRISSALELYNRLEECWQALSSHHQNAFGSSLLTPSTNPFQQQLDSHTLSKIPSSSSSSNSSFSQVPQHDQSDSKFSTMHTLDFIASTPPPAFPNVDSHSSISSRSSSSLNSPSIEPPASSKSIRSLLIWALFLILLGFGGYQLSVQKTVLGPTSPRIFPSINSSSSLKSSSQTPNLESNIQGDQHTRSQKSIQDHSEQEARQETKSTVKVQAKGIPKGSAKKEEIKRETPSSSTDKKLTKKKSLKKRKKKRTSLKSRKRKQRSKISSSVSKTKSINPKTNKRLIKKTSSLIQEVELNESEIESSSSKITSSSKATLSSTKTSVSTAVKAKSSASISPNKSNPQLKSESKKLKSKSEPKSDSKPEPEPKPRPEKPESKPKSNVIVAPLGF